MLTIKFRRRNLILMTGLLALLVGCTPSGPRALLQGKRLIDEGKYPEAVEKLQAATALLGTNALAAAQAWNYLGVAYHHTGDTAGSEKAYQHALSLNHDLAEAHYNLGCLLLAENKLEPARTELTAYALRRGNSPEGFLKLGVVQFRAHDLAAADKSFNDALRLSPQNPEALNGLGLVRIQQRRFSDAAQCFSSALKAQVDYRPALLNLAIVNQSYLKDRAAALQKYREYVALKPAPANADAVAETIRELEQEMTSVARPATINTVPQPVVNSTPPRSTPTNLTRVASGTRPETLTNTQKANPTSANARSSPGVAPASNPPVSAPATPVEVVRLPSEPSIKPAQDLSSQPAPTHASTAQPLVTTSTLPATASSGKNGKHGFLETINPLNLFHNGEKSAPRTTPIPAAGSAQNQTPQAPSSTPSSSPGATAANAGPRYQYKSPAAPSPGDHATAQRACDQAVQAYKEHRIADAAQAYRQATQLDPAFFEAQYNYGLVATDAGNLNAALTAYEYALAIRPDSADARYNFALVLKQAKYFADAADELEALLAAHPNEARAHLALANIYAQQLSQASLARQHYSKVLELDSKNPQAAAIRLWLKANPQ